MQRRRRVQNVGHAAAFSWPCVKMIPTTTRARMYILSTNILYAFPTTIHTIQLAKMFCIAFSKTFVLTERVVLLTSDT